MNNTLSRIANSNFARLSARNTNAVILRDLVKKIYLRESVILYLKRIEKDDLGINWWQDSELMNVFKNMYQAGVLPLPFDAVERIRWIALICVSVCIWEEFSFGNLISSLDYLPTSDLDDSVNLDVARQILELRDNLKNNGWEYVFGWKGKHAN